MALMTGVLPHWQDVPADDFAAQFPRTQIVGVNLDQRSAEQLRTCILPWKDAPPGTLAWAGQLGDSIYAKGRQCLWSVPYPGAKQLEAVVAGDHDDLYIAIATEIKRIAKLRRVTTVYVRPPWEQQLRGNIENRVLDRNGNPSAKLGKRAWRVIASHFMAVFREAGSPVLKLVWSPAVEVPSAEVVPWESLWPGVDYCDIIAPDLYVTVKWHSPGVYTSGWFRNVLIAFREFAYKKGKPFGAAEFGADSDLMEADVSMARNDIKAARSGWAFIIWWNDWQVVDCRVTGGRLPKIAAAVAEI